MLKILFITGATHKKYMINLNHYQRVYFLSRNTILTIITGNNSDFSLSAKKGTKVINSPLKGNIGILLYCFFWLLRKGKKRRFDIVITEPSILSICGFFARIVCGIKWVVDIWDIPIRCQSRSRIMKVKTYIERRLIKKLYTSVDLFIVSISPNFELESFNLPHKKMLLLNNAIWIDKLPSPKTVVSNDDHFEIMCVRSRYTPDSGLDVLSKAFGEVSNRLHDVRLTIVGKIPNDVKPQVASLAGLKNAKHYDFVDHNKLLEMARIASACVIPFKDVPDLAQTYPVKVIEYLCMGAVILASDIAGLKSMIKHGQNGLLFRAGDYRDLADKICLLYKDNSLRETLSKNARQVNGKYDCINKNEIIIKKLENIVSQNKGDF